MNLADLNTRRAGRHGPTCRPMAQAQLAYQGFASLVDGRTTLAGLPGAEVELAEEKP